MQKTIAFLTFNKKKRDEHHFFFAENKDDAIEFIQRELSQKDGCLNWVCYEVGYLLSVHKAICDKEDYDYEFNYEEDIILNQGAYIEVLDLMNKFPTVKPSITQFV